MKKKLQTKAYFVSDSFFNFKVLWNFTVKVKVKDNANRGNVIK